MDIVKRAYLKIREEMAGDQDTWDFHNRVQEEIKRLIRLRAYSTRDWPRELGPLPDELRSKKDKVRQAIAILDHIPKAK